MTSTARPNPLRLVPISNEDYLAIGALDATKGQVIDDGAKIGQTFALYFSFPKYASVAISSAPTSVSERGPWIKAEVDHDRDEREPSELWVRAARDAFPKFPEVGSSLEIQFALFGTCFTFSAPVLAVDESMDQQVLFVIPPPTRLTSIQQRALPRIRLSPQQAEILGEVQWRSSEDSTRCPVTVYEMGVNSIAVISDKAIEGEFGHLRIGDAEIPAQIRRRTEKGMALSLMFETPELYGQYFDIFRKLAYPNLAPRSEFPDTAAGDLFAKTSYIGKFASVEDHERYLSELRDTWASIKSAQHYSVAEYFALDGKKEPVGCSSLALAFRTQEEDIWAFHQLCATTSPELLLHSGDLYKWRAEYLAGYPGRLSVIGWFDGRSRWLDRLYVKFTKQTTVKSRLNAIQLVETRFSASDSDSVEGVASETYAIGGKARVVSYSEGIFSGAMPTLLNASRGLDKIVALENTIAASSVRAHGAKIAKTLNVDSVQLRVSIPFDWSERASLGEHSIIDVITRMFLFSKEDLVSFISAVEHSIAITRRKYNLE